jgi:long-chain acyl-CoA synthetase
MIAEQLRHWAATQGGRTALQLRRGPGQCDALSYRALYDRARDAAAALAAGGIGPGDRVALCAESGPDWVAAYLAVHFAGAAVIPLDAQYGAAEIAPLLAFAAPAAVLVDDAHRKTLAPPDGEEAAFRLRSIAPKTPGSLADAPPAPDFAPVARDPDDVMAILFTSGTTGDPKGVQLTCRNIQSNIEAGLRAIQIRADDNVLNILPLHHAYASTAGLFAPLAAGATVTFCPSLKGPDLMATMQETGVTILPGVPQLFTLFDRAIFQAVDQRGFAARTLFGALYAVASAVRRATGLRPGRLFFRQIRRRFGKRFRFCLSGGAKLDEEVARHFLDLGIAILEGYGLTETSPVIAATPLRRLVPGTVGLPLDNLEVRIERPDAEGIGEICVRGPSVMKGYYRNPEATAAVLRDNWFYTGDLGRFGADGMLRITGRAKEVIVLASGKNIYPDEIEARYEGTPFVAEICILPIEGPDGGTSGLRAVVVPDTAALAARGAADAREWVRGELAKRAGTLPSYMRVGDLVLFDGELPRTRLGKLRRARIAEEVAAREEARLAPRLEALGAELRALMEHPASCRFLERLEDVANVTGPFTPVQDLAIDLGVDSLTQIQLTVVLEQEFGVRIPEDELAGVRTVGDVLRRVTAAADAGDAADGPATELSWAVRLREPVALPLDARFRLRRGPLRRLAVALLKGAVAAIFRLFYLARIRGRRLIPRTGRLLLCPNHLSHIDPPLLYALFPERLTNRMVFVAFGDIFRRPPLSWVVGLARLILTGGAGTLADSLKLSAQALERDMAVCIFPEGARATDDDFLPARPGAGILACETGAPIVPVLIEGAQHTLSPVQPRLRLCRVRVVVGAPIAPPQKDVYGMEDYTAMVRRWEEAIRALRAEARGGAPS